MRIVLRMLFLAALLAGVTVRDNVQGQSMSKNLTGPVVTIEGLKSQTSSFWKQDKAAAPVVAKFVLPKATSSEPADGELTVAPATGDTKEILDGLKKKFTPLEGQSFDEKSQFSLQNVKVGSANASYMDIKGNMMGGDKTLERYRMLAVVFEVKDKKYLIKAQGPLATMTKHRSDFNAWVAAFK